MEKMEIQEMISALADGQLRGDALARVVHIVATEHRARCAWHDYHLIGDVLRSGELAVATPPSTFLAKFQVRLEREQTRIEPAEVVAARPAQEPERVLEVAASPARAANDSTFRWKMVAGFASLAAVTAVGWTAIGGLSVTSQPQLASASQAVPASAQRPLVMIRDPRLDEMLAAHRQFGGGASALQMPAGFLRNATFEAPSR